LGLTQEELAEEVGQRLQSLAGSRRGESCTDRSIRKIERGERPGLRIARGLALALGIPAEEQPTFVSWLRGHPLVPGWHPDHLLERDPGVSETPPGRRPFQPGHRAADQDLFVGLLATLTPVRPLVVVLPPPEPVHPPRTTGFVGRIAVLHTLDGYLSAQHLAIVTGPPGVGKTMLMAAVARRWPAPGRVFWHVFRPGEGATIVVWRIAAFLAYDGDDALWRQLHMAPLSGGPPLELQFDYVMQRLRGRDDLLCFDDLQVADDDQQVEGLMHRLLAQASDRQVTVIIASRHSPRFAPPGAELKLGGLSPIDARRLMAHQGLVATDDQVAALIRVTEGFPQFLLLAIDLLRMRDQPDQVIDRLSQAEHVREYLLREVDDHLTPDERTVMGAVSILADNPGGREAIEAILGRSGIQRALTHLGRRHLLHVSTAARGREYGLHAVVQSFYYDELSPHDRQTMHLRAGAYYATEGMDDLRAAQHFLLGADVDRAAEIATADIWMIINRGRARALLQLLEQLADDRLAPERGVAVCIARGEVAAMLGEREQAEASYSEAIGRLEKLFGGAIPAALQARVCRGMGELLEYDAPQQALTWLRRGLAGIEGSNSLEEALLLLRIGSVLIVTGEQADATLALERSLVILPDDAHHWRAGALLKLGVIACATGRTDTGLGYYQRALTHYQHIGDEWGMIGVRQNLGIEKQIAGDWAGAAEDYLQALDLAQRLGSVVHQTDIELCLGVLRTNQGVLDIAEQHLRTCLELARRHQLREQHIHGLSSFADLQIRTGGADVAADALAEAEQIARETGATYVLPEIYRGIAQVHLAHADYRRALDASTRAVHLARELDAFLDEGSALRVLGQVQFSSGQPGAGIETFMQSRALLAGRDPYEAARTLVEWGRALLGAGEPAAGQELLREACATFERLGAQRDRTLAEALL
jgi:tetratricopeptide (TPR) repeat protein/transcriptional regulator with XRE-family HTH domain